MFHCSAVSEGPPLLNKELIRVKEILHNSKGTSDSILTNFIRPFHSRFPSWLTAALWDLWFSPRGPGPTSSLGHGRAGLRLTAGVSLWTAGGRRQQQEREGGGGGRVAPPAARSRRQRALSPCAAPAPAAAQPQAPRSPRPSAPLRAAQPPGRAGPAGGRRLRAAAGSRFPPSSPSSSFCLRFPPLPSERSLGCPVSWWVFYLAKSG